MSVTNSRHVLDLRSFQRLFFAIFLLCLLFIQQTLWAAPPTISGFSFNVTNSATTVTITGTNFTGTTAVQFNNGASAAVPQNAVNFTVNSATQILATVPADTRCGNIIVTTPDGVAHSNGCIAPPFITGFTPTSGGPGTVVTVNGRNLIGFNTVIVSIGVIGSGNATNLTIAASVNSTQLKATIPDNALTGPITVIHNGGNFTTSTNFTVPTGIQGISPTSGPAGTQVIIDGTNFSAVTAVKFNTKAASFTVLNNGDVRAEVPLGATTGTISVTLPGGTLTGPVFTVIPLPAITGFSPTSGVAPEGNCKATTVVIRGTNFLNISKVKFFNGLSAQFTVDSPIQITAKVPAGAVSGQILLETNVAHVLSQADFNIPKVPTPTISNFSPAGAVAGKTVTINGTNFLSICSVSFGLNPTTFNVLSQTQLTAVVPSGGTNSKIQVENPGGVVQSANFFFYPPNLTGFSPQSAATGSLITLNGSNLVNSTVKFNGVVATQVTASAGTTKATVPNGASSGPITVSNAAGSSTSTSNFNLFGPPVITGFSPTVGGIGTQVTITGTFSGSLDVKINGVNVVNEQYVGNNIQAFVPAGATTGHITVTTPAGVATSSANFTVVGNPTITSFSPTGGSKGSSVVINGTNFTGATSVAFNGVVATFTVNSPIKITAIVPSAATTGGITVTAPGGSVTSVNNYSVSVKSTIP